MLASTIEHDKNRYNQCMYKWQQISYYNITADYRHYFIIYTL